MKPNPELIDDENPEWTEEDFKRAVTFSELPTSLQVTLKRLKKTSEKVSATIEFDQDIFDTFRATGADWQHQINVALKQWLQEHSLVQSV
ncbi:MAG: BrnA antitoxin family protein [Methylococcaceae bacterium]